MPSPETSVWGYSAWQNKTKNKTHHKNGAFSYRKNASFRKVYIWHPGQPLTPVGAGKCHPTAQQQNSSRWRSAVFGFPFLSPCLGWSPDSLALSPENRVSMAVVAPSQGCTQQSVGRATMCPTADQLWKETNVLLCNRRGHAPSAQNKQFSSAK